MSAARKFGWFSGVFTPSILTILGVIMYLRLPAIVGQAGRVTTLGIIALAHVISITTGLSVATLDRTFLPEIESAVRQRIVEEGQPR